MAQTNHKLTIGIDLDGHTRKALARTMKQWQGLPLRIHQPESYHIPLLQLGWTDESHIAEIIAELDRVTSDFDSFGVQFLTIAPKWKKVSEQGNVAHANTVVCQGESSEELRNLHGALAEACGVAVGEKNCFAPHVTLAQMRRQKWEEMDSYPELSVPFAFDLDVMHITLFEQGVDEHGKNAFMPVHVSDLQ